MKTIQLETLDNNHKSRQVFEAGLVIFASYFKPYLI